MDFLDRLRRAESIERPIGDDALIQAREARTQRVPKPGKRDPKPATLLDSGDELRLSSP